MIKAPKTIVMVRHGRTEANDVYSARRKGLPVDLAAEIRVRSTPDWRRTLSQRGIEEAKVAGDWIEPGP